VRYLPRDFVETSDGLLFAVVDRSADQETIPCFLRYCRSGARGFRKLGTQAANDLLRRESPKYLFHCERRDAALHGVDPADVVRHLRPRDRLQALLDSGVPADSFEALAVRVVRILAASGVETAAVGVTGSVLVGSHGPDSDIDLVLYDAATFRRARDVIATLISRGVLAALNDTAWRDAYRRRGCALTYDEFVWHEQRKLNKVLFEGTKLDFSLVLDETDAPPVSWRKLGAVNVSTTVSGDAQAFDYPARYQVADEQITEVVAFTATYSGQARVGERIEVCGLLEQAQGGERRVVVGTDREASGQYIRVVF